jgi:hypothetical protein
VKKESIEALPSRGAFTDNEANRFEIKTGWEIPVVAI